MSERDEVIKYTADVVCLRGNQLLVIQRGWPPHKGKLALPGGHVDKGETSRAAAARELKEETGVEVDPDRLTFVGVYDQPDRDPRGRYVTAAYLANAPAWAELVAGDDAANVKWVSLADIIRGGGLAFDHDQIVKDAERKRW